MLIVQPPPVPESGVCAMHAGLWRSTSTGESMLQVTSSMFVMVVFGTSISTTCEANESLQTSFVLELVACDTVSV